MASHPSPTPIPDRSTGLLIGIGSFLSVVFMFHHPSVGSSGTAEAVAEMSREAAVAAAVHGGLIAIMAVILVGFVGLSDYLGFRRLRVRAATLAYGLGVVFMLGAAMVSGFFVSGLASAYEGSSAAELETLRPVLRLCYEMNQSMAKAGTVALSAAILLWSWVLLSYGVSARLIGTFGFLAGIAPVVGLLGYHLRLDVHGMGAVVFGQAVWSIAVAVWLMRVRARARA